jgi:hypothetical protein
MDNGLFKSTAAESAPGVDAQQGTYTFFLPKPMTNFDARLTY